MSDLSPRDLESQINAWRQQLIKQETLAADDLEELEQHLRDSFGRLKGKGLNDEEAFLLASHRLGGAAELATEYAKVDGAPALTRRICWMLTGYLLVELLTRSIGATSLLVQAGVIAAVGPAGHGVTATLLSAVVWLACWAGVLYGLYRSTSLSSSMVRWLEQLSNLGLAGIVVSLLFFFAGFRVLGSLLMLRLAAPQEFGEVSLALAYAGPVIRLLLPILLLRLLLIVRKRLGAHQAGVV